MDINKITYKINGAIYEVNRELGADFLEKVYENALLVELMESVFWSILRIREQKLGDSFCDCEGDIVFSLPPSAEKKCLCQSVCVCLPCSSGRWYWGG